VTRFPWQERNGRFSSLKATCFGALFLPGLWVLALALFDALGSRPVMEAIHQLGLWAIRLMFLSLAITPLRQAWRWPGLIVLRRMIGVAAFCYAAAHFGGYVVEQSFDLPKVFSEIVSRIYLTIGTVALLALMPLALTSTDGMIRRIGGRNWRRLHASSYGIAALVSVHYFMQSKLAVEEATVMGGLYLWLMSYRLVARLGPVTVLRLTGISAAATGITGFGEAEYFNLARGVDLGRILAANFSTLTGIRPAVFVAAITLAVTLIAGLRAAGAARILYSASAAFGRAAAAFRRVSPRTTT
jgi:methionine sulfoxide reductase heme-binding subunit